MAGEVGFKQPTGVVIGQYLTRHPDGIGTQVAARHQAQGQGMTPDEVQTIVEVIDTAIRTRMEEVYGELEALKQQVRDATHAIGETLLTNDETMVTQMTALADGSWRRFIETEARALGLRIVKEKS
jgi:hypothetical protein